MVEWILEKLDWHVLIVRGSGRVSVLGTPWGWLGVLQDWEKFSIFVNETMYRTIKKRLENLTWIDDDEKKLLLFKLERTRYVTHN